MSELFRYAPLFALGVSILAFLVSGFSLGWNVYRDVILKPRVKVTFASKTLIPHQDDPRPWPTAPFLELKATNHGPGEVVIDGAVARLVSFPRLLFTEIRYQFLIPDFTHPCGVTTLPTPRLAVGDQRSIIFPYEQECFLAHKPKRVGVVDSFGRTHWASRRELRSALQQHRKSFLAGPSPTGTPSQ